VRYSEADATGLLDWCDLQPWRSPYVLFAYASCSDGADLQRAVDNFEGIKSQYKKTLIEARLFVEMTGCLEERLAKTMKMLNPNPYNISNLNMEEEVKKSSFVVGKNLASFAFSRGCSLFHFDLEAAAEKSRPKVLDKNGRTYFSNN